MDSPLTGALNFTDCARLGGDSYMAEERVQRRLAAILAAAVAGYTRLTEQGSESTVAAWRDARGSVIDLQVAGHSAIIGKPTGDGGLIIFLIYSYFLANAGAK